MTNEKSTKPKIYGYDEGLWHRAIRGALKTGDRDIGHIASLLKENNVGKRILDLGCGIGRISNRLALRGYDVVGIDLSEHCIEEARDLAKELGVIDRTRYLVGDYTRLAQCVDGKFDAAVCILASSWKDATEMTSFYKQLVGFMKTNSILIIQDTLKETLLHALCSCPSMQNWYILEDGVLSLNSWRYNPQTSAVTAKKEFYEKTTHGFKFISRNNSDFRVLSIPEFTRALKKAGWTVTRVEKTGTMDLLELEVYNDPRWKSTATIVAIPRKSTK
ncbi:MAG TPA: methyltransferase domain-containing protein [Candidatus Bathyarchaeia archaeon]|nr:methyltransferase domain-containing protein [Candidatus Bathyarchaeia archaeon]